MLRDPSRLTFIVLGLFVVVTVSGVSSIGTVLLMQRFAVRAMETAPRPQVLRAEWIELVDGDGRVKMLIGFEGDGYWRDKPQLVMYGPSGRDALRLSLDRKGYGSLAFQDGIFDGKLTLGHSVWCDMIEDTPTFEKDCGLWGLNVLRSKGAPMFFGMDGHEKGWVSQPSTK